MTYRYERRQSHREQAARERRYRSLRPLADNRDRRPERAAAAVQPVGAEHAERQVLALRLDDAAVVARNENLIGHADDVHEDEQEVGEVVDRIQLPRDTDIHKQDAGLMVCLGCFFLSNVELSSYGWYFEFTAAEHQAAGAELEHEVYGQDAVQHIRVPASRGIVNWQFNLFR